MKKWYIVSCLSLLFLFIGIIYYKLFSVRYSLQGKKVIFSNKIADTTVNNSPESKNNKTLIYNRDSISKNNLPKQIVIKDVPFIVQAPFSNWQVHHESCEEASALIVHNYLSGYKDLDMKLIDLTIRDMKEFQIKRYGEEKDLYNEDFVELIKQYFKYKNVKAYTNATLLDLKTKLSQGIPVIVQVNAGMLSNPNMRHNGYHVLVAIGYDDDKQNIITNDPGTIHGKMYSYSYSRFESAMVKGGSVIIAIEDNIDNRNILSKI
ncbi:MAG: C39 family peptidase [Candidatus Firestonebacteria bacterium]|nr:C39 family peptidase [Candidatus Firestonebacteria bacterium]